MFELENAQNINHIVVFLLGTIPFEPGYAATVHLLWPNKDWQLLGGQVEKIPLTYYTVILKFRHFNRLSNEKASAIFRLKAKESSVNNPQISTSATLGISIEPIAVVQQELSTIQQPSSSALVKPGLNVSQVGLMAERVLENLYNYVTSFTVQNVPINAIPIGQLTENGYLPLKTFQTWYENLSRKLAVNPNYLDEGKTA